MHFFCIPSLLYCMFSLFLHAAGGKPLKSRLWISKTCPYACRAWIASVECSADCELKEVNLKEKPEEFVKLYSSISPIESASAKVPIWEGESNLIESSIIAEYIAERHPAVGLVPSNADEKAIMRLCVDTYEKTLGSLLIKCLKVSMIDGEDGEFSSAKTSLEKEIGDSLIALNIFLTRFGTSNGGAFLFGDRFSLAEVLVAPFLQRLFPVAKHFAQIDVLEMASSMNLDRFQAWVSAILERPSVLVADVDEGALIESMGAMRERFKTTP